MLARPDRPQKKEITVRLKNIAIGLALSFAPVAFAQAPSAPAPTPAAAGAPAAAQPEFNAMFVTFKVKAGKEAEFEKTFHEMAHGVHDHEPGNVRYELLRAADDPHTYFVFERYKGADAVAAHGKSPHGQKLIAALRDLVDGRPEAKRMVFVLSK